MSEPLGFAQLEKELVEAPATWVPALLRVLVETAVKKGVFRKGGLMTFVKNAEEDATK